MSEIKETFLIRATAHARDARNLSPAQHWRHSVSDEDVAAVFYAIEAGGVVLAQTSTGRWLPSMEGNESIALRGLRLTTTVQEMIRTGLLRRVGPLLIPARVHIRNPQRADLTACLDPVEGMREGRVRTVDDLALVDCLECEAVVASRANRRL